MPIGVRIPVANISIRFLIGMVHALLTPGICRAVSISAISLSIVNPLRHAVSGLRLIKVSDISKGAESVAVNALPALPNTDSTSGKSLIIRSCNCNNSAALVGDNPGKVCGINNSVPSFKVGINSPPNCLAGYQVAAKTSTANNSVIFLNLKAAAITG